jgi:glucosamine--fructose-6-phosphate aminotransferase (isomerizing)
MLFDNIAHKGGIMQFPIDGTYVTLQEILSQPAAWKAVLQELERQAATLNGHWKPEKAQEVIFTGCGSTYYLSRSAAEIFKGETGALASAYPASDLYLFPDLVLTKGISHTLVAISRSGETSETLRAADQFRSREAGPLFAITCYEESPLAKKASVALIAKEAHETSVAQTRSFSSMLVAVKGLAAVLAGRRLSSRFWQLPELGVDLISSYHELSQRLGSDPAFERFFFLGSGPLYGLACEAMLKMKEMSLSFSEAYQFLEFRHGPMSMVNKNTLIVGLLSETAFEHEARLLSDMRKLGAQVFAITPVELSKDQADHQAVLPGGLSDLERGALYLPLLQLLAFYRSVGKGLNPDKPTNLTAVVNLDLDPV